MTNADLKIASLTAKIADLEARLTKLTNVHRRDVKALMGCDDVLDKHRKVNDAELADAFERIKKIELTLFPHLPEDIARLDGIIGGGEANAYNPLDFRSSSKKPR